MSGGIKNIQDYFKVKPSEERARQSEHEGTNYNGEPADSETVADDGSQDEAQSSESPTISPCECPCCTDYTTPHQPSMNLDSSKRKQPYLTKQGECTSTMKSHTWTIQSSWYKLHPWISVCTTNYKVFCATCLNARDQGLLSMNQKWTSFVSGGFSNWKNALAKFREHEGSNSHKESAMKLAAKKCVGIDAQLSSQLRNQQAHHRTMLMRLLESIQFLVRQGLPLRGHKEGLADLGGNLYQLLLLRGKACPGLTPWLKEKEYTSPIIVNEFINQMGQSVLRKLLSEASASMWFSILADEATDVSHNEQMSISIRWVDTDYDVHEDTLGLIQLPNTRAETIFSAIKDILIRCSLPMKQCCGQAYDGAANMSDTRNGVQALFKRESPHTLYVHCLAHSLNLCVKEVTRACDIIRDTMSFVYELTQLIKMSPKRLSLFDSLRKEITFNTGEITPNLRMLCPTRWTVRHGSIGSILRNYSILQNALDEIKLGHDEYAAKGNGIAIRMEYFDTFFGLKLSYLLFSASEQLSINLQAKDITVQEAVRGAKLLVSHLKSLRTDAKYNAFYEEVIRTSEGLTSEPTIPRQRKLPKRLDDGANPHVYLTPKDRFRHKYFETLELAVGEIERRFNQEDIGVINSLESFLIDNANDNSTSMPDNLETYLKDTGFDLQRLKVQVPMLPSVIKTSSQAIKQVTSVRTIVGAMAESDIYKGMLPEINRLLKLYLTFPVTTATAERSFSSLRRVKTYAL